MQYTRKVGKTHARTYFGRLLRALTPEEHDDYGFTRGTALFVYQQSILENLLVAMTREEVYELMMEGDFSVLKEEPRQGEESLRPDPLNVELANPDEYNGDWIECDECKRWRWLPGRRGIEIVQEHTEKTWRCNQGGDGRSCSSRLTKKEKAHGNPAQEEVEEDVDG